MKLQIKILLLVLIIGAAGPFFIKRPDGRPWLSVNDFTPDVATTRAKAENWWSRMMSRAETLAGEGNLDLPSGKTQVYRWRGENGSWQYSDVPPAGKAEEVWVDPNVNVIQSTPVAVEPLGEKEDAIASENGIPLPLSVSPERASKLMDDAKNVQKLMDQRNKSLEKAFNDALSSED